MGSHTSPPGRHRGSAPLLPGQDALRRAVELLTGIWGDCQEDLVAVIPIAVPAGDPPETAPSCLVAMADDREALQPGAMAVTLTAAADAADMIARLMLAGRPGFTAWARVERSGAFNVIRQYRPRSSAGLPAGADAPPPAGTVAREGG